MTPRGRDIASAYYQSGVLAGIEIGHRQADAEAAAEWAHIRAVSLPAALADDAAVMAERRGQLERAAAIRRSWRERGVA